MFLRFYLSINLSIYLSCQDSARSAAASRRRGPRAMQQVSASAVASSINGTQCGAALTIYALTKTGSSFVRAHFEHAVLEYSSWVLSRP